MFKIYRKFQSLLVWLAVLGAIYVRFTRPWHLHWGTTTAEATGVLPGDDLVPEPKLKATHAITIQAPVAQVWPWLVQIGQGRGGFYSYDWLEMIGGLDIHSADKILPEFQTLNVGDILPLGPNNFGPKVVSLEPERALVVGGELNLPNGEFFGSSWSFNLEAVDANTTRLVERLQLDWVPLLKNDFFYRVMLEPASFVMERKMLLGIKQRAERLSSDRPRKVDRAVI